MKLAIDTYNSFLEKHSKDFKQLSAKTNLNGIVRLITFSAICVLIYFCVKHQEPSLFIVLFITIVVFGILIKVQKKRNKERAFVKTLKEINEDEINYLLKKKLTFYDGKEFANTGHAYSHDLDFFGKSSLYQNINRTGTYKGASILAQLLEMKLGNDQIIGNQEAVKELSSKVKWRQSFYARAILTEDSPESNSDLFYWLKSSVVTQKSSLKLVSYLSPIAMLTLIALYIFTKEQSHLNAIGILFGINLVILGSKFKGIKEELMNSGKIDEILKGYSVLLASIEQEDFTSAKLIRLQEKLKVNNVSASVEIKELSKLFSQLDQLLNLYAAPVSNGLALFHIHVFRKINEWKKRNAQNVKSWLDVIGEIEALSSLANFSYNNPNFAFPSINTEEVISFDSLGHPLINNESRVDNDVSLNEQNFMILTGSNMSGKSTFLRALGLNMVLTNIGAPVCATKANVHPLKVWVSMRLVDSLEDSESYFFAEVKRLKEIMEESKKEKSFVLLDEILRGTNSDDKRFGTVEVIKKLIKQDAIGAIATHDLEVCETTNDFPNKLINKCFEVEIINDDLVFDYTLRNGICKNKSATFLMEKMEII